jgi:PKHD-type hydroxylase
MYRVLPILTPQDVEQCRQIAASTEFIDGKVSNPHNAAKNNQQLHDAGA